MEIYEKNDLMKKKPWLVLKILDKLPQHGGRVSRLA